METAYELEGSVYASTFLAITILCTSLVVVENRSQESASI